MLILSSISLSCHVDIKQIGLTSHFPYARFLLFISQNIIAQPLAEDEDLFLEPIKRIVRPENQIQLSEEALKEEVSRVLTGDDPNASTRISKYNYKEKCYKPDPPGQSDHMAVHFTQIGNVIHVDSDEYKVIVKRKEEKKEASTTTTTTTATTENSSEQDKTLGQEKEEEGSASNDSDITAVEKGKNQFNYSDRSSQTFNNSNRNRAVSTEPPPVTQYSATVSQWLIYDTYIGSHLVGMIENKNESMDKKSVSFENKIAVILDEESQRDNGRDMAKSLKIMERLVNQNAEDEIYQDFKYWEDASDQFREGEGSLLPLWRFTTERSKRKEVTALCWNPRYSDFFAVGYGSYDFMKQGTGMICCFSLKNTSFPEFIFSTESGVVCLDFHPQHPSLLAVGCYDGTVMVYNVSNGSSKPIYSSTVKTGKHTDPVWQVYWQKEDLGKELNFYSVSSDGRVVNWSMSKNELKMEPVMQLKLVNAVRDDLAIEETSLTGLAGGCCFDFNEKQDHLFIVGTEEGNIHKCSKAYSGQYLETYEGHHMAVYAVRWNPFDERIFISCSADWTVKLWNHNLNYPIMSFDLGNAVGDVCWSSYSSTVFSAVTSDGKVHVFDLAENKHEPLCEQKVVKRAKLTHACFNSRDFIVIVGDDRGGVNSLKLSPNLRKLHLPVDQDGNVDPNIDPAKAQREKMEKLLTTIDVKSPF